MSRWLKPKRIAARVNAQDWAESGERLQDDAAVGDLLHEDVDHDEAELKRKDKSGGGHDTAPG